MNTKGGGSAIRELDSRRRTGGKGLGRTCAALLLCAVFLAFVFEAQASFSYRRKITVDHTKVSGGSDISNFPMSVGITTDSLKHTSFSGGHVTSQYGYDIIFRLSDGTTLDHTVEKYTSSTGAVVARIRVPTLSVSTGTVVYMYYGNSSTTTSQENEHGV
jgi:hypothetical protein